MSEKEADRLSLLTGCLPIETGCEGLQIFFEPRYSKRIAICGIHGKTDIDYKMAIALAENLRGIAEMYLEGKDA